MSTGRPHPFGRAADTPLLGTSYPVPDPRGARNIDLSSTGAARAVPTTMVEAVARMLEAEDTLRAIGAGEIDALVVSDRRCGRRVFSASTAERPYRMFVENMRDGAATVSATGLVLYANGRLVELLDRPAEQIVGATLADFVTGLDLSDLMALVQSDGATVELDLATPGGPLPVLVGIAQLAVDGGRISCLTFADLTAQKSQDAEILRLGAAQAERLAELQAAQSALTRQATHDALTGLPNRALLVDRIEQALVRAERTGLCTAVYFIDLDDFKRVNDTRGHAAGDEVLRSTARHLTQSVRALDTVARIGGDEFIVLSHDVDNEVHAADIGTRLVADIHHHNPQIDDSEPVTASIGIAVAGAGGASAERLLIEADAAMYQAKSQGGDRAVVFDASLGLQVQQRYQARRMLQSALDEHLVLAFYQPILDLGTGRIDGFEALARLDGGDGTVVMPGSFISIAEESGLIVPLGAEVLALACAQAGQWNPPPGSPPLSVAVNLSSRQFDSGDLVPTVSEILRVTGLAPERLHLELTETATIDLRSDVIDQLGELRDLGIELGLDDFGTGYGSLTHLRRLPLTFVKIDQTFVKGLGTDSGDGRIVAAVVTLAANLGLRSIAEGIETPEQLELLRETGCDQAQGYLFARPMPLADVAGVMSRPPHALFGSGSG